MGPSPTLPRFAEVLAYLERFTNYERVIDYHPGPAGFGTARMEALLARLGHPEKTAPALHVAGTKGKGSTATLAAALLSARGLRTGLYTSPHVYHLLERIRIDGAPLGEEAFCRAFARVRPEAEALAAAPRSARPTYFEILTAVAFVAFAEARVDALVVEVGLGGRLDATNVEGLRVRASAVTPVSRDHTRQLGSTLESIATEKAGILREGVPVVLAPQAEAAGRRLRDLARRRGCPVLAVEDEILVERRPAPASAPPGTPQMLDLMTWRGAYEAVPLPLLGDHQAINAATALGLAERFLEEEGLRALPAAAVALAWRDVPLPGRTEILAHDPLVLFDGAHNDASAWCLAEMLRERFGTRRIVLVLGAARDKPVELLLRILAPLADRVVLTAIPSPRSMDPAAVAEAFARSSEAEAAEAAVVLRDPAEAVAFARRDAGPEGVACLTGSLYLGAPARAALAEENGRNA